MKLMINRIFIVLKGSSFFFFFLLAFFYSLQSFSQSKYFEEEKGTTFSFDGAYTKDKTFSGQQYGIFLGIKTVTEVGISFGKTSVLTDTSSRFKQEMSFYLPSAEFTFKRTSKFPISFSGQFSYLALFNIKGVSFIGVGGSLFRDIKIINFLQLNPEFGVSKYFPIGTEDVFKVNYNFAITLFMPLSDTFAISLVSQYTTEGKLSQWAFGAALSLRLL